MPIRMRFSTTLRWKNAAPEPSRCAADCRSNRPSDLGRLDPEAIAQVRAEAWPMVRDAEELHDTLHSMCLLRDDEAPEWKPHFDELVETGRALTVDVAARVDSAHLAVAAPKFWTVAERWPLVKTLYPEPLPSRKSNSPNRCGKTGNRPKRSSRSYAAECKPAGQPRPKCLVRNYRWSRAEYSPRWRQLKRKAR